LKNSLILGFAGVAPSHAVPTSASADCGVDAKLLIVVFVCTGVKCTCGRTISWAFCTDSRVSGSTSGRTAILFLEKCLVVEIVDVGGYSIGLHMNTLELRVLGDISPFG
jgi:hypothetical protein